MKRFFAAVGVSCEPAHHCVRSVRSLCLPIQLHSDAVARYAANLRAKSIESKSKLRAVASETFLKSVGVKDEHVG